MSSNTENAGELEHDHVFYIYEDDEADPRFSFWIETDEAGGMSLYERPPDGVGMWLKPDSDSDYGRTEPTEEFEQVIADLMGDGLDVSRLFDLPAHERHFTQVIHGTIDENPDAIPNPVWGFMHECADARGESDE